LEGLAHKNTIADFDQQVALQPRICRSYLSEESSSLILGPRGSPLGAWWLAPEAVSDTGQRVFGLESCPRPLVEYPS
jgi:hypothetical protein